MSHQGHIHGSGLVGVLGLHSVIILNLSSEVYGPMVTDTVPTEPEADTLSGRAGGPRTIETVPKEPEADTPSG
jgi:hypothetical protein